MSNKLKMFNRVKLVWIIVVLLAINLSMIGTIIYNSAAKKKEIKNNTENVYFSEKGLCQFLIDDLKFDDNQKSKYLEFKDNYLKIAKKITTELQMERVELMDEMAKEKSDTLRLNNISKKIGNYHASLKKATYRFYLNVKNIGNKQQKKDLSDIFYKMTNNCSNNKECKNKCSK